MTNLLFCVSLDSEKHFVTGLGVFGGFAHPSFESIIVTFLSVPDSFLGFWNLLGEPFVLLVFEGERSVILRGRQ